MRNLHNIEKSGFHKGEYVGYAGGAWRIARCDRGWIASKDNASFVRGTLGAISDALKVTADFYESQRSAPNTAKQRSPFPCQGDGIGLTKPAP